MVFVRDDDGANLLVSEEFDAGVRENSEEGRRVASEKSSATLL